MSIRLVCNLGNKPPDFSCTVVFNVVSTCKQAHGSAPLSGTADSSTEKKYRDNFYATVSIDYNSMVQ